ncbi:MAG: hypothetical protein U9O98_10660, partial [Asgard group archaeon]|nr:hypothetical protein [Asgard group archaeon]
LITTTLGNLIGLYTEMNDKKKAKELLDKLVTLLETSDDLITPFRAYAVSTNALMLEQDNLAKKYLKKLEEKVEKSPTNQNKAILANAKMSYFTTAEINSNKILKWGTEALYHLNKQKDYLNILATLFNLIIIELEFYNITERKQFLNSAKKRLNELVTLTGVLDLPTWLADKNVAQACMEILSKNYDYAESIIKDIPESEEITIQKKKAIIQYLLDIVIQKRNKERKKAKGEFEEKPEIVLTNPPPLLVMKEIADDQDAMDQLLIYFARKSLQNLVSITTSFDPEQTDIKLILLINEAGLPIYTKVFDEQKINKNLISNFISAIDSFGKRLFGTAEPYFSFQRGKNTILYQSVTPKLNLAILVSKENYDAVMKLTQINKEISAYLKEHNIDLSKTLDEKEPFHQWLEEEFTKLNI